MDYDGKAGKIEIAWAEGQAERMFRLLGRRPLDDRDRGWGGIEDRGISTWNIVQNGEGDSHVFGCIEKRGREQLNLAERKERQKK